MAKRTWTYEDITAEVERSIISSMTLCSGAQERGDHESARHFANFAWGAWRAWDLLTAGWQEPGDSKRLETLTEVRRG